MELGISPSRSLALHRSAQALVPQHIGIWREGGRRTARIIARRLADHRTRRAQQWLGLGVHSAGTAAAAPASIRRRLISDMFPPVVLPGALELRPGTLSIRGAISRGTRSGPERKMVELGLLEEADHDQIVLAEDQGYARNALVQLRRIREGTQIEEDHMRNRQMIVQWLLANSSAIEVRRRDGKTYYAMVDAAAFRAAVGRLLAEVQRIKAEGDYEAAKALFETYGVHFDAALRDESSRASNI